jgi:hypothetical protein
MEKVSSRIAKLYVRIGYEVRGTAPGKAWGDTPLAYPFQPNAIPNATLAAQS